MAAGFRCHVCDHFLSVFFSSIRRGFRTRATLQAEILALRHQLSALQRANRDRKLRLNGADRMLWVWLSRLWSGWRFAAALLDLKILRRQPGDADARIGDRSSAPQIDLFRPPPQIPTCRVFGAGYLLAVEVSLPLRSLPIHQAFTI